MKLLGHILPAFGFGNGSREVVILDYHWWYSAHLFGRQVYQNHLQIPPL